MFLSGFIESEYKVFGKIGMLVNSEQRKCTLPSAHMHTHIHTGMPHTDTLRKVNNTYNLLLCFGITYNNIYCGLSGTEDIFNLTLFCNLTMTVPVNP
jgi:hypothetical protein